MPGPGKQLFNGVKNTIVKMKKAVLQIMPDKMHIHLVNIGSLPAMITKITFKWVVAVFANSRHRIMDRLFFSRKWYFLSTTNVLFHAGFIQVLLAAFIGKII